MYRSLVLATTAILTVTAVAGTAQARQNRFAVFDANSGKKIFDDGRLDGRACAVGKKTFFNPITGNFTTVPAAVSFTLDAGETLGIVGESGSGKSTLARLALALESPDTGAVHFLGRDWTNATESQRRPLRRSMSMIYQDPLSSFDPRWTVDRILEDSLAASDKLNKGAPKRILELLDNGTQLQTSFRSANR